MSDPDDFNKNRFVRRVLRRYQKAKEGSTGGPDRGGRWYFYDSDVVPDLIHEEVDEETLEKLRVVEYKFYGGRKEVAHPPAADEEIVYKGPRSGRTRSRDRGKIHKPAGHLALELADLFYTEETCERVFEAAILDFRAEHHEALAEGNQLKAWIRRGQLVLIVAGLVIRHGFEKLVKPFEPVLNVFR